MQNLRTPLDRVHPFAGIGVVLGILLLGYFIGTTPLWDRSESVPSANTSGPRTAPGDDTRISPLMNRSVQRYLTIAQQAVTASVEPHDSGQSTLAHDIWHASVIADSGETGSAVVIHLPLEQIDGQTNAEFTHSAKQQIGQIINALFATDPSLVRVGIIGKVPTADGKNLPAISVFIKRSASSQWGSVAPNDIERLAQSVYIHEQFLP